MDEPVPVGAPLRELTAVRVHRQLAAEGDRAALVDPVLRLAEPAEPEALEPRDGVEREAVVDEGEVDVVGGERRAGPQVLGLAEHLGLVGHHVLIPREPFEDLRTHRLDADRLVREITGDVGSRDDHGDGRIAGHVAVVQAERRRDHAGRQVVVHGHRVAVDGVLVASGTHAVVDGDVAEQLPGGAVLLHVLAGVEADPRGRRHGAERGPPLVERARHPRVRGREEPQRGVGGLPHGAHAQHVTAQAGRDREHGGHDRTTGTGQLHAAVDPRRVESQRVLEGAGTPFAHPHRAGTRIGRDAVDVARVEARIGDGLERRVDGECQGVLHQPAPDGRPADARKHAVVLEAPGRQRGAGRRDVGTFDDAVDVGLAGEVTGDRGEQRDPHILVLLEVHGDALADVHVLGRDAGDVGGEVDARCAVDRHVGHRIGRREPGKPLLVADADADDRGRPGHDAVLDRGAVTGRADRRRRHRVGVAVGARLDAELAVGARDPEPLVERGDLGEGADGSGCFGCLGRSVAGHVPRRRCA